jgi:MFS family permease
VTVFLLGAALFGSMILLPLYYQVVRGQTPLQAGLLMMPQGIGAAIGMNVGGRVTDRVGAGRVVPVGLLVLGLGTIPYALIGADTSYAVLLAGLFVRGLGLGASMMPAMAAAYATLRSPGEVPRATPMLNVVQRVGGSLGVAILTVILQNRIESNVRAHGATPQAVGAAFSHAYAWSLVGIAIALVPALLLMREERRARLASEAECREAESEATAAEAVAA